jgi:hypothetical protein
MFRECTWLNLLGTNAAVMGGNFSRVSTSRFFFSQLALSPGFSWASKMFVFPYPRHPPFFLFTALCL